MDRKTLRPLTEVELEMMLLIWKLGPSTVHQVLSLLPKERNLAYTSVSTMLRILEQKSFLKSTKDGRSHVYSPLVSKEAYQSSSAKLFLRRVFDGAPKLLVKHLIENQKLSTDDLRDIQKLLEERTRGG